MPNASNLDHLPIDDVLPELLNLLNNHNEAVLQAEPGAGKTTRVPLALLQQEDNNWLHGQRILMLEPRRLAARNAATFMAKQLGEDVGQTIGYRVRFESKISPQTRIEVITEGILNRYLQNDPSLEGIGVIIFDEFHERNLDADLGLALTLQGRQLFRDVNDGALPLKLLIMSATLDDTRIANMLGTEHNPAPIIQSKGRQYPVDIFYEPQKASNSRYPNPDRELINHTVQIIQQAITNDNGSILVFLPGQKEIRHVQKLLHEKLPSVKKQDENNHQIIITPLFGDLNLHEQQLAIAPTKNTQRKVVLATAIAESSLTIHGVNIVIDAGKSRIAAFDARTGMTRLQTIRLSKAASVQRAGRAGRLQAGRCYRLWSSSQQQQLAEYAQPEILQADLAPLALQLIHWGIHHPNELSWLDSPPKGAYQQAIELLHTLGAIHCTHEDEEQTKIHITTHGQAMAQLPAHPRIAHMLLVGKNNGLTHLACQLAALLTERDILSHSQHEGGQKEAKEVDIRYRLDLLNNKNNHHKHQAGAIKRIEQQVQQFKRLLNGYSADNKTPEKSHNSSRWMGFLIACAYPDRIAKQRSQSNKTTSADGQTYLLSNGRAATLSQSDRLGACEYIAVSTLGGQQGDNSDHIYLAAELDSNLFNHELTHLIQPHNHVEWNNQTERFSATQEQRLGALIIESKKLSTISDDDKHNVIFELIRKRGLELLPWNNAIRQWQARVQLLRTTELETNPHTLWPDVSDAALLTTMENWLGPYIQPIQQINDFKKLNLHTILENLLPWPLPNQLNEWAPTHITVPSGSHIPVDYTHVPPVLAMRLQEMFGCAQTPHIGNDRIPLTLHLLSPARRPLQITRDLASFWQNTYPEVKKDMKGRYPKHHWPDNPMEAIPTARIKPRSK